MKSLRLWWTYALDPVHRRVARDVRATAMYWVEGIRSSQPMIWAVASPMPLRHHGLAANHVSFFGGNRNSGVFQWFRSNSEFLSYDQKEVPVKKFLRKKQESQGIRRNPGRNEKQSPRNGHSWNRKMQPRSHAAMNSASVEECHCKLDFWLVGYNSSCEEYACASKRLTSLIQVAQLKSAYVKATLASCCGWSCISVGRLSRRSCLACKPDSPESVGYAPRKLYRAAATATW